MVETDGIVVATDRRQEWLLPWWWSHYSAHNVHPVCFFDLGMSGKARRWCRQRGEVVRPQLPGESIGSRDRVDPMLAQGWEASYGKDYWHMRKASFCKPFVVNQSPFLRSVWLDLDCEVLLPIGELFDVPLPAAKVALVREGAPYNSGVIVFERGSPLLQRWMQQTEIRDGEFWGDQNLLTHLIACEDFSVVDLPLIYNWRLSLGLGVPAGVKIVHWVGEWGKRYIQKYGGISSSISPQGAANG